MKIRTIREVFLDPTKESEKVRAMRLIEGYACVCEVSSLVVFRKIEEVEVPDKEPI